MFSYEPKHLYCCKLNFNVFLNSLEIVHTHLQNMLPNHLGKLCQCVKYEIKTVRLPKSLKNFRSGQRDS
jgi:hypothetical protein